MEGDDTMAMSMAADLIARARTGDGDAFQTLTDPYRRQLRVHCYRMLGSLHDAEDALQETLLSAWNGLQGFEGRASVRTWLYRIATNTCLNARRSIRRRAAKAWNIPGIDPLEPTGLGEIVWLEPFPDALFGDSIAAPLGPEARYEQTESMSLAFIRGLQILPPRQLAVLILRDVLGFHAAEVAEMLGSTVESVTSALKRARAGLKRRQSASTHGQRPLGDAAVDQLAAKFVRAYEAADVDALVALLTDDVFISMPPMALEYEGRDIAARVCVNIFGSGRRFRLVPTRANGQLAFGTYLRTPDGRSTGTGLIVLTIAGDRISAMTRFEGTVLPSFGLPAAI